MPESTENRLKTGRKIGIFCLKVIVYGRKGDNCIDECITYMLDYGKYLKEMTMIRLKVIVYGEKGDNCIYECITYMLDYEKMSQGEKHDALS